MKIKISEGQFSKIITKYLRLEKVNINKAFVPDKGFYAEDTVLIHVEVDHSKLSKNSPEFDPKYFTEMTNFDDDKYESSLDTVTDLLGVPYYAVEFTHLNLDVYDPLLKTLQEAGLDPVLNAYSRTPFVEITYDPYLNDDFDSEEEVHNFIWRNGYDTEDIVLLHRW